MVTIMCLELLPRLSFSLIGSLLLTFGTGQRDIKKDYPTHAFLRQPKGFASEGIFEYRAPLTKVLGLNNCGPLWRK